MKSELEKRIERIEKIVIPKPAYHCPSCKRVVYLEHGDRITCKCSNEITLSGNALMLIYAAHNYEV